MLGCVSPLLKFQSFVVQPLPVCFAPKQNIVEAYFPIHYSEKKTICMQTLLLSMRAAPITKLDYGSVFVTCGEITETKSSRKESSFPAEAPLIKLIGAANRTIAR